MRINEGNFVPITAFIISVLTRLDDTTLYIIPHSIDESINMQPPSTAVTNLALQRRGQYGAATHTPRTYNTAVRINEKSKVVVSTAIVVHLLQRILMSTRGRPVQDTRL